jgi:hypothetical protein
MGAVGGGPKGAKRSRRDKLEKKNFLERKHHKVNKLHEVKAQVNLALVANRKPAAPTQKKVHKDKLAQKSIEVLFI